MQQRLEIFGRFLERSGLEKKAYQMAGVAWCLEREMGSGSGSGVEEVPSFGDVRGGFVADEMGLGKTITMLGLMTSYRVPKTLIVLPVALIDQWLAQIRRTTDFTPLVYHGVSKKRCVRRTWNAPRSLSPVIILCRWEKGVQVELCIALSGIALYLTRRIICATARRMLSGGHR